MALGDERLNTTNQDGSRFFLYPAHVKGFFRKYRTITQVVLILFFLLAPWIKLNGLQFILLDIPNRTFIIMGLLFKSHDAPLIFLFLATFTFVLALLTALFGRVWCGWACPQTVFIDGIYRKIETWILGNYLEKRKLARTPWTILKIKKISTLWVVYFIISSLISHSFVAYFVGADRLISMMGGMPHENFIAFTLVFSMTLILMFNFGWFREQFCIIACPYGRFQATLMDKKSQSVLYDYGRGEPRKGTLNIATPLGDCVSCNKCVEVCPTGIDIRRGIQMECIGCTACIDACDEIMEKVNKPKGLIRYSSEYELETKKKLTLKERYLRPRVLIYFAAVIIVAMTFAGILKSREPIIVNVLRLKGDPYTVIINEKSEEVVVNHITLHLHNQSLEDFKVKVINKHPQIKLVVPSNINIVKSNQSYDLHLFAEFSKNLTKTTGGLLEEIIITYDNNNTEMEIRKQVNLVGPF